MFCLPSFFFLLSRARDGGTSAAVVFLPERTTCYGEHGSDECHCEAMYGRIPPWGCRWFQLWREHIQKAVECEQTLHVYFFEGIA
jgi:hypothetical protein